MLSDARLQMRVFATAKLLSEKLAYVIFEMRVSEKLAYVVSEIRVSENLE
jgi:hypothetical protein